jgi:predicted lipoprotein with Yx(FWY)xxD motif
MPRILPLIASLSCAAALTGCGDDSTEAMDEPQRGPLVKLRDSQVGRVLFSGRDRALYTFTRDPSGRSRCHGECAEAWPPFFAKGPPRAAAGVKRSLIGTVARGRRRQVTYRGQPLYFYEHDPRGEVLCNDIVEFGGTWFAVTAAGRPPA